MQALRTLPTSPFCSLPFCALSNASLFPTKLSFFRSSSPSLMAQQPQPLELRDLKAVSILGRGAKGVVFLVRASTGEALALKAVSRSSIERRASAAAANGGDAYRRVWIEHDVLLALRHPLLPSLRGVVSTDRIVGFAIDRCSGGDLASFRRLQIEKTFSENVIRFYAAELVIALEYLHGIGIVYRDLKPENILIQDNGHLMLVDFDLSTKLPSSLPTQPLPPDDPSPTVTGACKKQKATRNKKRTSTARLSSCFTCNAGVSPETAVPLAVPAQPLLQRTASYSASSMSGKSNSFVGTEEYVAPEIIEGIGHDFAVDWWGLGVVLYEMLYGRTPFRGPTRKETFCNILAKEPELIGEATPIRDLIRRLLEKDPLRRIACGGVKAHEFFRGVMWEEVVLVSRPPFIPPAEAELGREDDEGFVGLDVERTVEEISAAKQELEKMTDGKREDGVNISPPKSADFSLF